MKRRSSTISPKRPPVSKTRESNQKAIELPEVGLAAVVSYKRQKEVFDFVNFLLPALDRNADWLNAVVTKQNDFKCAMLVGAGPNRFQLQEIIYPCDDEDLKLEVEMKDSEDHDKIAIAALLKLSNLQLDYLTTYIKTRMMDNELLREDLLKGKAMGISFVILRPIGEKLYRLMDRIVIGSSVKNIITPPLTFKKRRGDDKPATGSPIKKTRKNA